MQNFSLLGQNLRFHKICLQPRRFSVGGEALSWPSGLQPVACLCPLPSSYVSPMSYE